MDLSQMMKKIEENVGAKTNASLQAVAAAAAAGAVTLLGVEQYPMGIALALVSFAAYLLYEKMP